MCYCFQYQYLDGKLGSCVIGLTSGRVEPSAPVNPQNISRPPYLFTSANPKTLPFDVILRRTTLFQPILPPSGPCNAPWFSSETLALYKSLTYLHYSRQPSNDDSKHFYPVMLLSLLDDRLRVYDSFFSRPYNSSAPCRCTDVFMIESCMHTNRLIQPTSSVVNTCGPTVSGRWSFRGIDWTVLWSSVFCCCGPDGRPGIRCRTVFVTQLWVLAYSGVACETTLFCELLMRRT